MSSQEDPFLFTEYQQIIQSDEEIYDFVISFEDGDGIKNLGVIQSMTIPPWLTYEEVHSSPFAKALGFSVNHTLMMLATIFRCNQRQSSNRPCP